MKWEPVCVGLIVGLTLTGCVRLMAPHEYRIHSAPLVVPHHAETGTVVFLWPNRFADVNTVAVWQDDTVIGALRGSTAFAREVVPGRHRFTVDRGPVVIDNRWLEILVHAGQTIYVQYTAGPTGYVHFYLTVVPPEVAMAYLPKLSAIELVTHDPTPLPTVEELKPMVISPDDVRRVDAS